MHKALGSTPSTTQIRHDDKVISGYTRSLEANLGYVKIFLKKTLQNKQNNPKLTFKNLECLVFMLPWRRAD